MALTLFTFIMPQAHCAHVHTGGKQRGVHALGDAHMLTQPQLALAYTQAACALMAAALRCPIIATILSGSACSALSGVGSAGSRGGPCSSLSGAGSAGSSTGGAGQKEREKEKEGGAQFGHRDRTGQHQHGDSISREAAQRQHQCRDSTGLLQGSSSHGVSAEKTAPGSSSRSTPAERTAPTPGRNTASSAALQHSSTQQAAPAPTSLACTQELVSVGHAVRALWPLSQRAVIVRMFTQMCEADRGQSSVGGVRMFTQMCKADRGQCSVGGVSFSVFVLPL